MTGQEGSVSQVVANLQYGGEYRDKLEEARKTGQCPFCKPEFQENALKQCGNWIVMKNNYPMDDWEGGKPALQLLFVSVSHGSDLLFPTAPDFAAIEVLIRWCKGKFGFGGGGFCFRDGDPELSGKTVRHPHAHYIVPRRRPNSEGSGELVTIPVNFPVG